MLKNEILMVISIIFDEIEQLFVCFVGHSSFFSVNCILPCALDCPWIVRVMGLQVFFMKF